MTVKESKDKEKQPLKIGALVTIYLTILHIKKRNVQTIKTFKLKKREFEKVCQYY